MPTVVMLSCWLSWQTLPASRASADGRRTTSDSIDVVCEVAAVAMPGVRVEFEFYFHVPRLAASTKLGCACSEGISGPSSRSYIWMSAATVIAHCEVRCLRGPSRIWANDSCLLGCREFWCFKGQTCTELLVKLPMRFLRRSSQFPGAPRQACVAADQAVAVGG